MGFKYTISSGTVRFLGYDILEDLEGIVRAISDAGYDGVDLPGDLERLRPREVRAVVQSVGLRVPEVLGAWAYFHAGEDRDLSGANEEARRRGIEYAKRTIDLAAELGAQFFQVCAPQPPVPQLPFPELPIKTLRRNFVAAMREICAYAEGPGVTVLLEPLNLYEAYPGVLTTVHEATALVKELQPYDVGIQPDIFHMNIGDPPIPDTLREAGQYVRHMHVNETNHYALGTGHADYREMLKALRDIRYTGYLAVYMPYTTREAYMSAEHGYGHSIAVPGERAGKKHDLRAHLEGTLRHLKSVESTIYPEQT